ncbi:MAG: permease [Gammaproteobacteria bacterium]|nr:permease [Gammaproteobacteria bacterium]MDH5591403.1 permease [Gammaproteobacteria bacterium]
MSSCCSPPETPEQQSCCGSEPAKKSRPDLLLWITLSLVALGYVIDLVAADLVYPWPSLASLVEAIRHLMDSMWIGLALGMLFVGLLGRVPREFVTSLLGKGDTFLGILRATIAGLFLDLCSHGILLVAMRLYQRGASLGQVMAFLIASPWNSLSLTVILIALIGWKWTLLFVVFSMMIGIISGLVFDLLVRKGALPSNPNTIEAIDFQPWIETKKGWRETNFSVNWWSSMAWEGIKDSRMIVRWLLLGVILASAIRTFVPIDSFQTYFGATLAGLGMTLIVATILEICSEGSTPIAADLVTRAQAPGNGFAFLMTGVATDYTEIMSLRETTGSWKVALFLPIVTVPQVVVISWVMNLVGR